jgi:hypothetical protein
MKWMNRAATRVVISLAILSLLISVMGVEVCGQRVDVEETVMDRARIYEPAIVIAATRQGVDARLLWVIAYLETRFNPALVSRKGARGMMQFMPATAARFGLVDPHDPIASIDAAARYVRYLGGRFNRADLALAAYNAGETTVEAYLTGRSIKVGDQTINPKGLITRGIPPYRETQSYVANGLRLLETLRQTRPFLAEPQSAMNMNKDTNAREADPRSGGIVRKSIRVDIPVDERQSSQRTIYFVPANEDH